MSKELKNTTVMSQVITFLNTLLDRANHDEYLTRIGKKEALKFLEENEKYTDIIKSNLQRLEAIDNANPSEAMKCINYIENKLDTLKHEYKSHLNHRCDDLFIQKHIFTTIKQYILKSQEQEKVLKIIKEKNVDIWLLKSCLTVELYNYSITKIDSCDVFNLTQEEFDLLKEMFRDV